MDYAKKNGYLHPQFFIDDGHTGTNFNRPAYQQMHQMAAEGKISTIIVKDLSRLGRSYIDTGNNIEIEYLQMGVRFISIQENVDNFTGSGMQMMPFYNIFNEWYAQTTSTKIKDVYRSKSEHGKRVSSMVAFGYKRKPDAVNEWIIDEPAAEVVKRIFSLCLAGNGISQIARILENEKILTPVAYYYSIGRKTCFKRPDNPYSWTPDSIDYILTNRQYTGCTVNFKSKYMSFKVKKSIDIPEEEWVIIPDTQEAIIDEDTWLRVQELRKNKRRNTKIGRKSIFSGLVFCADCGAKLHYAARPNSKEDHFRCSNYKSNRGSCSSHIIRNNVLEQIVLEQIRNVADFVKSYESIFLLMMANQKNILQENEKITLSKTIQNQRARISELDKLFERLYEDNVLGKISDERFMKISHNYEMEQKELVITLEKNEKKLQEMDKSAVDLRILLESLREFNEIKGLTPTMVNTLIKRIDVHKAVKIDGKRRMKIDIYFTGAGIINIPSKEEIQLLIKQAGQTELSA